MVNQTPISARIDNVILWFINQRVMAGGVTRNHILNAGAKLWLDLRDAREEFHENTDPKIRQKILNGFLKVWFPEAATR